MKPKTEFKPLTVKDLGLSEKQIDELVRGAQEFIGNQEVEPSKQAENDLVKPRNLRTFK